MRRFIVEVVLDAILLAFIVLLLGVISVAQPFPFGRNGGPDRRAPRRRPHRLPELGGGPRAGQPFRATRPRGADRAAAVLDDGALRRDHQRDRDLADLAHRPDQDRRSSPTRPSCGSSSRRRCTPRCRPSWTPFSASIGRTSAPTGAAASGASSSRCRPRDATSSSRTCGSSRSTTRSTRRAWTSRSRTRPIGAIRRWFARVVLGDKDDLDGRDRAGADRGDAPAARTDLREDRPDDGEPGDILPPEWIAELSKLQSEAAPFAYEDVVAIVTKELGAPPEVLYATFDPIPFAAASTAQVHQARLHDGTLVAVKVQRPRIQAKTQADLGRHPGAGRRRRAAVRGRSQGRALGDRRASSPRASSRSSTTATRRTTPAAWRTGCSASRRSTSRSSTTSCPASASSRWSSSTGSRSRRRTSCARPASTRRELGTVFIRAIIKQVLVDGFFHGDPHPGNILADPISKQIIFLDLGLVGQLNAAAAGRPPRPDLLDQGGRHPGHRRRAARPRQADPPVRRGGATATTSTGSPAST